MFGENGFFRFETGFVWFASFFKLVLNANVELFISILAALSILIKFAIFSAHRRPFLTIVFYLCCWYPIHEYTQIRAAVAFAFAFLAAEAFFKQRFFVFAAFVAIGSLFHWSIVALLVTIPAAWILASFRMPAVIVAVLGVGASLGFVMQEILSLAERLNPLTIAYAVNLQGDTVNLYSASNIVTVALLAAILFANSLTDRRNRTFFILVLFGLAVAVAFHSMPVFSHRLKEMFLIFLTPLAVNARCKPAGIAQMSIAVVLGGVYLYAYLTQGVI